jgi:hypothetical protein
LGSRGCPRRSLLRVRGVAGKVDHRVRDFSARLNWQPVGGSNPQQIQAMWHWSRPSRFRSVACGPATTAPADRSDSTEVDMDGSDVRHAGLSRSRHA